MPITPQEFVRKWRAATLKERSAAQEHFLDLCRLVRHPTPAEDDPTGQRFTFEAGVGTQRGGQGWADVWKRGHFAWEYKGKHANLDNAYQQLLQYREALENPPLLVTCDLDQIVIHTNFTNTVKQVVPLTYDDLLTPAGLQRLRNVFFAPEAFRAPQTTAQVTEQAAKEFAQLATHLRKWGEPPAQIAHFLIRLLFCLFAEDTGLLREAMFSRLVERTRTRPALFAAQLRQLFQEMARGGFFANADVPHFNGRLFDNDTVLELDSDALAILARVSTLDWSSIEPAILGTLFERSLDPAKRAQLGAHYTSRDDILLIVEPVLMLPLRRRWDAVQAEAQALVARRDAASGASRTRIAGELRSLLVGFAGEIAAVRVLDPACGSGNFLYVALKQLLDLEKAVITFASDISVGSFFPSVSPEQLRGIEVNEYAHELAQITVWIGYIQWLRDNGFGAPSEPILKPLETIVRMDAILAYDAAGQPVEPVWPAADVVIGNPPFVGNKKMLAELGNGYVTALRMLYQERVPGGIDLVAYWFERSRQLLVDRQLQRVGLLATQSIRAGANRKVLERIKASGDIFLAWSDRPWVLDGAAVRVSMVGFDDGSEQERWRDGQRVPAIFANLTSAIDLGQAQRLSENANLCFQGPVKVGDFDIAPMLALPMLAAPNPHLRPNSDVVKPWMNASDVTGRARGHWIIDFGELSEADAALYEAPFQYVLSHVKPFRDSNNDRQRRTFWWRLGRSGSDLRTAKARCTRIIVTPRVAKHRTFSWASVELVPDSRLFVFARDDNYFFGVLHSRFHEVWSLATSSRHGVGNDPTYNNTTCFETYPFPWPPGQEPVDDPRVQAVAVAAARLVELRNAWLNPPDADAATLKTRTLTALYNARPAWLAGAHRTLDAAVAACYGWPADLGDEEILARLLALNGERTA